MLCIVGAFSCQITGVCLGVSFFTLPRNGSAAMSRFISVFHQRVSPNAKTVRVRYC